MKIYQVLTIQAVFSICFVYANVVDQRERMMFDEYDERDLAGVGMEDPFANEERMMIDEYDERDLAGVDMEDPFANGIFVPIKHMAEFEENMFHDDYDNDIEEKAIIDRIDQELKHRHLKRAIEKRARVSDRGVLPEESEYGDGGPYDGGRGYEESGYGGGGYGGEYGGGYGGEYYGGGYGGEYGVGGYAGGYKGRGGYGGGAVGYVKPYYKKDPYRKPMLSQLLWCFRPDFNAGLGSGGIYRKMIIDDRFVPIEDDINGRHLAEDLKARRCFKFGSNKVCCQNKKKTIVTKGGKPDKNILGVRQRAGLPPKGYT